MSSSLRWLPAPLLVLMVVTELHADVAPPCLFFSGGRRQPRPWEHSEPAKAEHDVVIVRDPEAKIAELKIPRKMMSADASRPVSTRHAMAGLAISMAFVGGGLWCMCYRAGEIPKKKVLAGTVIGVLALGLLSVINVADATPPRRSAELIPVAQVVQLGEVDVNVVIVAEGDVIELVVPPEIADKIVGR